jgi:hypothetical protein
MTLARLARTRTISWLGALLWMSAVAAVITEPHASGHDYRLEHAVARSAAAGAVARIVAPDRSCDGVLFAPPERMAVQLDDERRRPRSRTTTALTGASRPRRLAFRYDATAPPRLL